MISKNNKLFEMRKSYNHSVQSHKRNLSRKSINDKFLNSQINNERLHDLILRSKNENMSSNFIQKLEENKNNTIEGRSENKKLQQKLKIFEKNRKTFFTNSFKLNYLETIKIPDKKENFGKKNLFLSKKFDNKRNNI